MEKCSVSEFVLSLRRLIKMPSEIVDEHFGVVYPQLNRPTKTVSRTTCSNFAGSEYDGSDDQFA